MSEGASGKDSQLQILATGKRHQGSEPSLARYRHLRRRYWKSESDFSPKQ